jgi:hypothetical protein
MEKDWEFERSLIKLLESIADSQKGQLESQLRIEKDTRDTNDRLLKIAESNALLLHQDKHRQWNGVW